MPEGYVLYALKNHRDILSYNVFKEIFRQNIECMIVGVIFIILGILAVCAIPFMCTPRLCSGRSINLTHHRACFCIEGVIFLLAFVILILSTLSTLEMAVKVDDALQYYPSIARDSADNLKTFGTLFNDELNSVKEQFNDILDHIQLQFEEIPYAVNVMVEELFQPVVSEMRNFLSIVTELCKTTMYSSGFTLNGSTIHHRIVETIIETESKLQKIQKNIFRVRENIERSWELSLEERQTFLKYVTYVESGIAMIFRQEQIPDWNGIYQKLNKTLYIYLPSIADSIIVRDNVTEIIKLSLQNVTNSLIENINKIKVSTADTMKKLNKIVETLLPNTYVESFRKFTYHMDDIFRSLDTERIVFGSFMFSGRAMILLLPIIHSIFFLIIVVTACIFGAIEMRNWKRGRQRRSKSFAAQVLMIGILVGFSLMWMDLLMTGIIHIVATITSLFCAPVLDSTIFTQFLDNPQIWKNATWLSTVLQDYGAKNSRMKVKQLLLSCAHNSTVYSALSIKEYMDMRKELRIELATLQSQQIESPIIRSLSTYSYPSLQTLNYALHDLESAWKEMDLNFITFLLNGVAHFQKLNLTSTIPKKLQDNQNKLDSEKQYISIQQDLHSIITENYASVIERLGHLSTSAHMLITLKENIHYTNTNLSMIKTLVSDMKSVMNKLIIPRAIAKVNEMVLTTNTTLENFVQRMKKMLMHDIGHCHILYTIFNKTVWSVCNNGIFLLNGTWMSLAMLGGAMLVTIILSCRLTCYFRGTCRAEPRFLQSGHLPIECGNNRII